MKKFSKKLICLFVILVITIYSIVISAYATDTSVTNKLVEVALNEVGYLETTYTDGTFYSKYGDWYGYPNGAWCAMFISWCANRAGFSTDIYPKFASCSRGKEWFQGKNLWMNKNQYTPKPGDLIFLNNCTHVGIVEIVQDNLVYTIEGNACDNNGENYGVRQRKYSINSDKITAYGVANFQNTNIKSTEKKPSLMLGDMDMNGIIDSTDTKIIQLYLVNSTTIDNNFIKYGDINEDSIINIVDASIIQKYAKKIFK